MSAAVMPIPTSSPTRWRSWLLASRPKTLWAAIAPVVVAVALAKADGVANLVPALAALLGAIFIQIGTNFYNDYADFKQGADNDQRVGPERATQMGWLKPSSMLIATCLAFGAATVAGVYLVGVAGWPIVAIGIASVVSGLAYTGIGLRLGYRGLGDIFVFVFFGWIAVAGTYYVQALTLAPSVWVVGGVVGSLAAAILVVNNLRDRHTDEEAEKRTLVVRWGATFGRAEYTFLVALPVLAVPLWMWFSRSSPWGLLTWLCLPLAAGSVRAIWSLDGAALNPLLGRTAQLLLVYSTLLSVGLVL